MRKSSLDISFQAQIFRNIVSGWLSILLVIATNVVVTPLVLNNVGKELYGVWFLIFNILAYFYLADFGITSAITRLYAKYKIDQTSDVQKLVSTSYLVVMLVNTISLIGLLSFKTEIYTYLEIEAAFYDIFTILFYVGLIELTSQFILRVNIGILKGQHKYDIAYRFEGLAAALRLISVLLLVLLDKFSIVSFAIVYSLCKIFSDSLSFFFIRDDLKGFKFALDKSVFRDLLDVGSSSLATTWANALLNTLPLMLFGKVFGVDKVFLYAIPFAILIVLSRLINAIYHGVTPKSAELKALNNEFDLASISSFGVKFAALFSVILISFFIVFGEGTLRLWLGTTVISGHDFDLMSNILLGLLVYMFFESLQKVNNFIYKATGLHWLVTCEAIVSGLLLYAFIFILLDYANELTFAVAMALVGVFKYGFYKVVGRNNIRTYSLPIYSAALFGMVLIGIYIGNVNYADTLLIKVFIYIYHVIDVHIWLLLSFYYTREN